MHGTTEIEKRYDPPATADNQLVDVKISVEGTDGEETLALADELLEAVEDTHREFRS